MLLSGGRGVISGGSRHGAVRGRYWPCLVGGGCAAQVAGDCLAQRRTDELSAGWSQKTAEVDFRLVYGLSEGLHVGC